jgi:hypothetical protein
VQVWSLDQRCKRYQTTPSQVLGIRHPVLGYLLDEAVSWYGQWVENHLAQRDPQSHQPLYNLNTLLGIKPKPVKRDEVKVIEGVFGGVRVRRA